MVRKGWVAGAVAGLTASVGCLFSPAHASGGGTAPVFASGNGLTVASVKQIDARQYDIVVSTPALGRSVNIRILLPADYGSSPEQRFPVLYLLHGTSGGASDWVDSGDAEALTANLPLITVMPDAGFNDDGGGWYTNWVDQSTALGPSQWETFHVDQLIPWVDASLRTVAGRNGRALAGLSQGGFGSMTYAAQFPDKFVSVASFSGAPDIDYNPAVAAGATMIVDGTAFGLDGVEPEAMFGSRATDEINWQGHDPADLIRNLFPVSVWLYTANGVPGPYDTPYPNPADMGIENLVGDSTLSFWQRARQVGLPVHMDDYVQGTHTWAYWSRDLSQYLVPLMQTFAHPPAAPSTITYQSVAASWSQWGWSVSWQRAEGQAWSSLENASARGFEITGDGTATVVTPPSYKPGTAYHVSIQPSGSSSPQVQTVIAGGSGRLTIPVALGGSAVPAVLGVPGPLPGTPSAQVSIGR